MLVSLLLVLCTALAAPAWAAQTGSFNLSQLAKLLAQNHGGTLAFTEYKYLHALKLPLRVEGTVSFTPPDHLSRIVTSPRPERFVVDGDQVTVQQGNGSKHVVQMAQYPQLQSFVDAFTATLNGNLTQLQKSYRVALSGNADKWTLQLEPIAPALAQKVKQIRIGGVQSQVLQFEIRQTNGDRSEMELEPAGGVPGDSAQ